jgi:type IV pilus assembly protein PilE
VAGWLRPRWRSRVGRRSERGFTLTELMIALLVIGVLLAFAVPSYREQVVKTRRAEGKALIADVAARLERCYTRFNAYNNAACTPVVSVASEEGWYQMQAGAGTGDSTLAANSFTLRAVPQRAQADDDTRCGTLTMTHTGVRGQTGTPPEGYDCW